VIAIDSQRYPEVHDYSFNLAKQWKLSIQADDAPPPVDGLIDNTTRQLQTPASLMKPALELAQTRALSVQVVLNFCLIWFIVHIAIHISLVF
jgi:hypothetical protein